jgi:hypothetical protein
MVGRASNPLKLLGSSRYISPLVFLTGLIRFFLADSVATDVPQSFSLRHDGSQSMRDVLWLGIRTTSIGKNQSLRTARRNSFQFHSVMQNPNSPLLSKFWNARIQQCRDSRDWRTRHKHRQVFHCPMTRRGNAGYISMVLLPFFNLSGILTQHIKVFTYREPAFNLRQHILSDIIDGPRFARH